MKCPFCAHDDDKVIDSRASGAGDVIRRRRECEACSRRFTTYERVDEILPTVVKKDGRRELFDREKLLRGISKACEKRPVSREAVEQVVYDIERTLRDELQDEVATSQLGDMVMLRLRDLDEVAYVRFASVYKEFRDLGSFMDEIQRLFDRSYQGQRADEQPCLFE